ncbi:hypothetical protein Aab01nite_60060 [Paractinoplanes abujensis]|nr:hypothetical protein Aab01nite_60060 [Actinoplanes abujensis]
MSQWPHRTATARTFVTDSNALDTDHYPPIAPECGASPRSMAGVATLRAYRATWPAPTFVRIIPKRPLRRPVRIPTPGGIEKRPP